MVKKDLSRILQELRDELDRTQFLHKGDRENLEQLVENIYKEVHAPGANRPVIDSLRDSTQRFEVSHPQLTVVLERLIGALTNMGI